MNDLPNSSAFQPFASADEWRSVYRTPWYSMTRHSDWFRVEPTDGTPGAAVFVVDADDRALLVKIYRPALDRVCLEIPRGRGDVGETAAQAARRELLEETGLAVGPSEFIDLGVVYPDSGILANEISLFAVRLGQPFPEISADSSEVLGLRMIPLAHLDTMIEAGLVSDVFTIAALKRLQGARAQAPREARDVEAEIEVIDEKGDVVISMCTRRPNWSFDQYCRNRDTSGWNWRFKAK
jgi:ADP-ribose pyrophosphatase